MVLENPTFWDAADWLFVLPYAQLFGVMWLLIEMGGGLQKAFGLSQTKRTAALIGALIFIWVPMITIWLYYGITPLDLWYATDQVWNMDITSKAWAIHAWIALLSPIIACVLCVIIWQPRSKKQLTNVL